MRSRFAISGKIRIKIGATVLVVMNYRISCANNLSNRSFSLAAMSVFHISSYMMYSLPSGVAWLSTVSLDIFEHSLYLVLP